MRYIKKYSVKEWNRFDIDMQEILCTKYNIRLIDFQTKEEIRNQLEKQFIPLVGEAKRKSKERKIQILKKTGHVMGEIAVGTLAMIQAFSSQPAPKKKRKRRK
uniref:ORF26 n=1 Tax=Nitrosopumilaceae spindle-shaped virus TaxID=3065433 RepID=A0AAT9J765_9VIRU